MIIKNIATIFLNRAAGAILGVATTLVVATLLSEADFGVLVAVLASVAIVVRVISLGFVQASQYFGAISIENGKEITGGFVLSILFIVTFSSFFVFYFNDALFSFLLPESGGYKNVFEYFLWLVPICIVHLMVSVFFLGQRDLRKYFVLSILPAAILFISVLIVFLGHKEKEFVWLSYAIQFFSSGVISLVLILGMYSSVFTHAKKSALAFINMARYGSKSYFVSTISFSAGRIAIVVSAWYVSSEDVATYSIARTIGEAIILIYGSVGPLMLSYIAGKEQKYGHDLVGKTCRITLIFLIPLALIISAGTPLLLDMFFGGKYVNASNLLWILLPGVVISTQQRTLENYLYGRSKQIHLLGPHLIFTLVIFGFTSELGSRYGVYGVAYAASLCNLILFIMTAYVAYKYDDFNPKLYIFPSISDIKLVLDYIRRRRL